MLSRILTSFLAVFVAICPLSITAHELSALGDVPESPCTERNCQSSPGVLRNNSAGACLPSTARTTTTTVTTFVSTTKNLVSTLEGEARSSQLKLEVLNLGVNPTTGIEPQQDNRHTRWFTPTHQTKTSELGTQVAGDNTSSKARWIGSLGLVSSDVCSPTSSVALGSAARSPPISGTAPLLTVATCASNISYVHAAGT